MAKDMSSRRAVRNYKFRIYPDKGREKKLLRWLKICRYIYNTCLFMRKEAWEKQKRSISRTDQQV